MEIRRVEKRFDAKSKIFDPSKRVVAEDNSFNPDRFIKKSYDPSRRVMSIETEGHNQLHVTIGIMKLISTLNQFGEVEISGTREGNISGITFVDGEYDLYVDLTDFPSVEIGKDKYFVEKSGAGILELALYIIRKTNYVNRLMGDNK